MNKPDDETRLVRPNYLLAAMMLMGLGYYIAFYIAEQPETPNATLLKILGIANLVIFGAAFVNGIRKLFTRT